MSEIKEFVIRCRAIIVYDGKLLVVKHSENDKHFALPGGRLELGEDIKDCMGRELVEELGIKPEIGKLLYVHNFLDGKKHSVEFFFEIKNGADYLKIGDVERTHAYEICEMLWIGATHDLHLLPAQVFQDFKTDQIPGATKFIRGSA